MTLHTTSLGTREVALDDEFEFHICGQCGVTWGMPVGFIKARRSDHRDWYCPNGHLWHFSGESDEERTKRLLRQTRDSLASERARHDQTQASLRATKGVVTKQRKKLEKVVAGVCPVDGCHRHFKDLRRHISTKHPDYQGQS